MCILHPVQSVIAVEVEEMNDSGVQSDFLHLLVWHLALHLTPDPPLWKIIGYPILWQALK